MLNNKGKKSNTEYGRRMICHAVFFGTFCHRSYRPVPMSLNSLFINNLLNDVLWGRAECLNMSICQCLVQHIVTGGFKGINHIGTIGA